METRNEIERILNKLYVHLQLLGLHNFFKSDKFDLFCEDNGLEKSRETIVTTLHQKFGIPVPLTHSLTTSGKITVNFSNFPKELVKPFLKDLLIEIYSSRNLQFVEIVVSFLTYYSRYNRNLKTGEPTPIDDALIRALALDLVDICEDDKDVRMYLRFAGYDSDAILSVLDPEPTKIQDELIIETKESANESYPIEIQKSLKNFKADFPDPKKVAFIIMQFGETQEHTNILISIRKTLAENGLTGIRADDKTYHDDKLNNILTYLHGCGFGIAVFETITDQSFNPNISLESGYLMGLHKPICLLKEKSLKTLPSDLVGRLYKEFSIEQCDISISNVLRNWLEDRDLVETQFNEDVINYTFKKEDITSIHLNTSDFFEEGWIAEIPKQSDNPDSDWQYWDTFFNQKGNLKIDSIIHRYNSIDDAKHGFLANKKDYASRQIDERLFIPKIGEEAYGYVSSSGVEVATFRVSNLLVTTCYYSIQNSISIREAERFGKIVDYKIRRLIAKKHSK
jgi:hypothetical protein